MGDWWLPSKRLVNAGVNVSFRGFLGEYDVTCAGITRRVRLSNACSATFEVSFQ
jgi:hypothetical protein